MCVQYIWGCSVHWGVSVHRGDTMSTSRDIQYIGVFNRNWKDFITLLPTCIMISLGCTEHPFDALMISPRCTHDIPPMYSWYPSDVLNIPQCTHVIPHIHHDIPPIYWTSPDVLMIPPDVLMVSPRCTEHPLMYWTHIIQGGFTKAKLCSKVYHQSVETAVMVNPRSHYFPVLYTQP